MIKAKASWKTFIEDVLLVKNGYKITANEIKREIQEITYKSSDEASATSLIVSYFYRTSDLIAFRFYNPSVRGYNEFSKNAYFYSLQFTKPTTYGSPGLEFNDTNKAGLLSVLQKGIAGKEVQFLKDDIIIKSELFIEEGADTHVYKYRYTKSPVIDILLNKNTNNDIGLRERTINLKEVFPGLLVD